LVDNHQWTLAAPAAYIIYEVDTSQHLVTPTEHTGFSAARTSSEDNVRSKAKTNTEAATAPWQKKQRAIRLMATEKNLTENPAD
jgi:hypothetical protein